MRPKHAHRAGLPSAVLYLLVHGELPPGGGPPLDGLVEAFKLKHSPTLVGDLRALWGRHAAEITAATPAGAEPWVVRVLRDPTTLEDDDLAGDDEEAHET